MNPSIVFLLAAVAATYGTEEVVVAEPAAAAEPATAKSLTGHHTTQYHYGAFPIFASESAPVAEIPDGTNIKTVAPVATVAGGNVLQYSSPLSGSIFRSGFLPTTSYISAHGPLLSNLVVKAADSEETAEKESVVAYSGSPLIYSAGSHLAYSGLPLTYSGVPQVYSYAAASPSVLTYNGNNVITNTLDSSKFVSSGFLPTIYSGLHSPFVYSSVAIDKAVEPVAVEADSAEVSSAEE